MASTHQLCCRERMSSSARDDGEDREHSQPVIQRENVVVRDDGEDGEHSHPVMQRENVVSQG